MAHTFAGVATPLVTVPGDESTGAPWVTTIVEGLALAIRQHCGRSWEAIAPNEPICKTAIPRNPNKYRPTASQLPALFGWVDAASPVATEKIASDVTVRRYEMTLLWLPSPAAWTRAERWSNFWVALDQALSLTLNSHYSPWTTSTAVGEQVVDAAGLWELRLGQGQEAPFSVDSPSLKGDFEGYEWKLTCSARVSFDVAAPATRDMPNPTVPNKSSLDVANSVTGDPFVLQSRLPKAAWE
jgi:hypothetical protein